MFNDFIIKEVVVKGAFDLAATITLPKGHSEHYPAVVIVGGTGGGDRDGNQKNFKLNIYKQLAETLSALGFVTIRYDKRGIGKSKGISYETGMLDLVDDVIANVKYLETQSFVNPDKIILFGHSEGCILSTIANDLYTVSGLILAAGAGVSLKTSMQEQVYSLLNEIKALKGIKGALLKKLVRSDKAFEKQNKLFERILSTEKDVIRIQLMKFPAKWLREHLKYSDEHILGVLKGFKCPILVVTGDKDVQTDSDNLKSIDALDKDNIYTHVIKDMDHMLKVYKGAQTILNVKKQYKNEIGYPMHPLLIEVIKAWKDELYDEEQIVNFEIGDNDEKVF